MKVAACVKHLALNNQELNRTLTSADVDDRTLHEVYYPAFRSSVVAGVATAMCSYNRINSTYACENEPVLAFVKQPPFEGFSCVFEFVSYYPPLTVNTVMSDWGATHSSMTALNAGLDQEMPGSQYFNSKNLKPSPRIDDAAARVLVNPFWNLARTTHFSIPPRSRPR
jgi:beta-glucosidase